MLTNNLKELINEVKEEKKRMAEAKASGGIMGKRRTARSEKRKLLGQNTINLFANIETEKNAVTIDAVEEPKGLNREEFTKLLEMIGLGTDKTLIDKLFWIFDDDGNGEVDHKELAVGLEMLKENTFSDKLDSNGLYLIF